MKFERPDILWWQGISTSFQRCDVSLQPWAANELRGTMIEEYAFSWWELWSLERYDGDLANAEFKKRGTEIFWCFQNDVHWNHGIGNMWKWSDFKKWKWIWGYGAGRSMKYDIERGNLILTIMGCGYLLLEFFVRQNGECGVLTVKSLEECALSVRSRKVFRWIQLRC